MSEFGEQEKGVLNLTEQDLADIYDLFSDPDTKIKGGNYNSDMLDLYVEWCLGQIQGEGLLYTDFLNFIEETFKTINRSVKFIFRDYLKTNSINIKDRGSIIITRAFVKTLATILIQITRLVIIVIVTLKEKALV